MTRNEMPPAGASPAGLAQEATRQAEAIQIDKFMRVEALTFRPWPLLDAGDSKIPKEQWPRVTLPAGQHRLQRVQNPYTGAGTWLVLPQTMIGMSEAFWNDWAAEKFGSHRIVLTYPPGATPYTPEIAGVIRDRQYGGHYAEFYRRPYVALRGFLRDVLAQRGMETEEDVTDMAICTAISGLLLRTPPDLSRHDLDGKRWLEALRDGSTPPAISAPRSPSSPAADEKGPDTNAH